MLTGKGELDALHDNERWRIVWRKAIAPLLSREALTALRKGLADDDDFITQGSTCLPEDVDGVCQGACPIAYAGWKGEHKETIPDVEDYFLAICEQADLTMGKEGASNFFLNWVDDTPRDEMRELLIDEIDLILDCKDK